MEKLSKQKSLTIQAFDTIKEAILDNTFQPGDHLAEQMLAEKLGISRTIIQRALIKLQDEGLVEKNKTNKRVFVKQFKKQEIIEIFEIRKGLESIAAYKSAKLRTQKDIDHLYSLFQEFSDNHFHGQTYTSDKIKVYESRDIEFHRMIARISQNSLLYKILNTYSVQSRSFLAGIIRYPGETLEEHLGIIHAIDEKRPEEAEELMQIHLGRTIKKIEEKLY